MNKKMKNIFLFSLICGTSFGSFSVHAQIDVILSDPLSPAQRTTAEYLNKICLPVSQVNEIDDFCKVLTLNTGINPELRDFAGALPPRISFEIFSHEWAVQDSQDQIYRRVRAPRKQGRTERNFEIFAGHHSSKGKHQEQTGELELDSQFGSAYFGSVYEFTDKLRVAASLSSVDADSKLVLYSDNNFNSEGISLFFGGFLGDAENGFLDLTFSYDRVGHDISRVVKLLDESELISGETDSSAIRASFGFSRSYSLSDWLVELRGQASWRRFETDDYSEEFGESALAQVSGGTVSITPMISNRLSAGLTVKTLWKPYGQTVIPAFYLLAQSDNDRSSREMKVTNKIAEVELIYASVPRNVAYLNLGFEVTSVINQSYGIRFNYNRYLMNRFADNEFIQLGVTAFF